MEMRQLEYLLAVVEEGGFTRAALRAHVAQPAISQQIAQLERELGVRLFDRSERRVRLTAEGEAFLPHARAVLDTVAAGRHAVAALHGVLAGRLTIGTVASPPAELLTPLRTFQHRHHEVRITLRVNDSDSLVADVLAGRIDTALIGLIGERLLGGPTRQRLPAALAAAALVTEPLVVAVARDHPLAEQSSVAISALRDERFACLTNGTGLRTVLETACAEVGFTPDVRAETDHLTDLAELVGAGLGIALVPRSTAEWARPHIATIELRRPRPERPLVLIWHRQRIPATAQAFLEQAGIKGDVGTS